MYRNVRRAGAIAGASLMLVAGSSVAAMAGEITGGDKSLKVEGGGHWGTELHGRSDCAFSGREDADGSPLRTQTPHAVWFGPEAGVVMPAPGTPGTACNPVR